MHWGARLLCSQKPFPCILLTPLALSERSGKLLISGGNGRFDVALCCGLAAEPAQSDKHLAAVSCLLFLAQRAYSLSLLQRFSFRSKHFISIIRDINSTVTGKQRIWMLLQTGFQVHFPPEFSTNWLKTN